MDLKSNSLSERNVAITILANGSYINTHPREAPALPINLFLLRGHITALYKYPQDSGMDTTRFRNEHLEWTRLFSQKPIGRMDEKCGP